MAIGARLDAALRLWARALIATAAGCAWDGTVQLDPVVPDTASGTAVTDGGTDTQTAVAADSGLDTGDTAVPGPALPLRVVAPTDLVGTPARLCIYVFDGGMFPQWNQEFAVMCLESVHIAPGGHVDVFVPSNLLESDKGRGVFLGAVLFMADAGRQGESPVSGVDYVGFEGRPVGNGEGIQDLHLIYLMEYVETGGPNP